mmetsp:Transcript_21561/g.49005  ORF Transcript_21561/g.49005 Transcript_21561/m.49005 type:complete len:165 (-) Transcript_21561:482-976(-)
MLTPSLPPARATKPPHLCRDNEEYCTHYGQPCSSFEGKKCRDTWIIGFTKGQVRTLLKEWPASCGLCATDRTVAPSFAPSKASAQPTAHPTAQPTALPSSTPSGAPVLPLVLLLVLPMPQDADPSGTCMDAADYLSPYGPATCSAEKNAPRCGSSVLPMPRCKL